MKTKTMSATLALSLGLPAVVGPAHGKSAIKYVRTALGFHAVEYHFPLFVNGAVWFAINRRAAREFSRLVNGSAATYSAGSIQNKGEQP